LNSDDLERTIAYWEAANYLTAAQIYLRDNPLLREPLGPEHVKPRLLGHWGTSPGLNLIYAHLNGLIRRTDAQVLYITGPGHSGPAIIANVSPGRCDRVLAAWAQPRMLTARATTSPSVTMAAVDWTAMSSFAVCVNGIVSVGLKAVALVRDVYR
jgi:hypothetical protein